MNGLFAPTSWLGAFFYLTRYAGWRATVSEIQRCDIIERGERFFIRRAGA